MVKSWIATLLYISNDWETALSDIN